MSKFDVVYAYTTDVKKSLHRIKIGKATRDAETAEAAALIRINEQFTAGNRDEKIELIGYFDQTNSSHTAYQVESALHKALKVRNVGGEWFDIENNNKFDFDLVKKAYNDYIHGSARPNSFPLRSNQEDYVNKAYNCFKNNVSRSFLLAAIMRFGKTFATYKLIQKMGFKRVLILSAKTDVKMAWQDDLLSHIDFDGWAWYDTDESSKDNPLILDTNNSTQIVFLTLQDAKDYDKKKLADVLSYHYDLVIFDEAHFATETAKTVDLVKQIDFDYKIEMSGTAFKKLLSGEYTPENTFVYGLIEEIRDIGKGFYTHLDLPKLNVLVANIADQIINDCETDYPNDDDGFKFSTLFAVDNKGKFVHPNAVRRFLDVLASSRPKQFKGISPYALDELSDKLDHTIWFLPKRVAIVKALAEMMRAHPFFSEYEIFVASGDNDGFDNDEVIGKVKYMSEIKKNKKTIVLSAGRFSTGVSVKKWLTVFLMNDSEDSPEEYFQAMFRSKTPDKDSKKMNCYAVDFNPDRVCVMQYKYAEITATYENRDPAEVLREFNDVLPIMNCYENNLTPISIENILEAMHRSADEMSTFSRAYMVDVSKIDGKIASFLSGITPQAFEKFKNEISKNDVNKGKTLKSIEKNPSEKKGNDIVKQLKERVLATIQFIPTYLHISDSNISGIKGFLDHISSNQDEFKEVTGLTVEMFNMMFFSGVINNTLFEKAIQEYNLVSGNFRA